MAQSERKFGLVYFDDDQEPGAGWAAVAGEPARRIMGSNELPTDTLWWTNIQYGHFYRRSEAFRNPNLRHDKYLVVSPKDCLREWGHNPESVDAGFTCTFGARCFDRIMRIAWNIVSEVHPKMRTEEAFTGKTLREDLRSLFPELEYPKGPAATLMKTGIAWEEFTPTTVRTPRGAKFLTLRRPRMSYANEMLQTPVPRGPFVHRTRRELKVEAAGMLDHVKRLDQPCMVEVTVKSMQPEVAPIYGFGAAIDKDKRVSRSWVAHPEFILLSSLADIEVRSVYMGREYWGMMPDLPDAIQGFLSNRYSDLSWSAGIVAEALWRAVPLSEDKSKAGPMRDGEERAQTSWQGAWIRAADKSTMFLSSMRLTELGYAVSSYGLGWVRCSVTEEEVPNLLKDGLSLGLVPVVSEVPDGTFRNLREINWQGDVKARNLATLTCMRDTDILWMLDYIPLVSHKQRPEYLKRVQERWNAKSASAQA
jgi:hypothetical protein